jgi:hypothetical protein
VPLELAMIIATSYKVIKGESWIKLIFFSKKRNV